MSIQTYAKNEAFPDVIEDEITVENNLGLVRLCAGRFRGKGIEYEELYSAGCVGLVKAVKSFDTSRGVRFSTYAVPVILGEIRRLFRDGGSLKVSRSVKERSLAVSRASGKFELDNGREPTISELSEITGFSQEEIIEALSVSQPTVSLTPVEDGEPQLDLPVESPETKITNSLALRQALSELSDRDKALIYCRFTLDLTQQATAERLGMTQVQVSRREKKLLLYLREKLY
ncbi:MAG: sigma-70 family RNA polymerase sigma factor [Oscillospiraceae bacterium]|nr:sigma-70 family RNA polymerase sigma factor [Oscillospiraceae bacterium]